MYPPTTVWIQISHVARHAARQSVRVSRWGWHAADDGHEGAAARAREAPVTGDDE